MSNLQILKNRANLLFKDSKNPTITTNETFGKTYEKIEYHSKTYDIESIFKLFGYDKKHQKEFKLSKAQHMIAQLAGFKNWQELIKTPDEDLRLPAMLVNSFKNDDDIRIWLYNKETRNIYNYEDTVNDFIKGTINAKSVLIDRLLYLDLCTSNEDEDIFDIKQLPNGTYECRLSCGSLYDKFIGTTKEEAIDKCSRHWLPIQELNYLLEISSPYGNNYDNCLAGFKQFFVIQDLSDSIEKRTDDKGATYYIYKCSCKRLMRHFAHKAESYDLEDAKLNAQEALYKDLVNKELSC